MFALTTDRQLHKTVADRTSYCRLLAGREFDPGHSRDQNSLD